MDFDKFYIWIDIDNVLFLFFFSSCGFTVLSTHYKVMSSQSVNLTTLFLGKLNPLSGWPVFVHILPQETENCPSWIKEKELMTIENMDAHLTEPPKQVWQYLAWEYYSAKFLLIRVTALGCWLKVVSAQFLSTELMNFEYTCIRIWIDVDN